MTAMAAVTDMQSWSSTYCPQSVSQWNAWPATGRSALQDLQSCAIQSSSICCTHVRQGRPRWRFHSGLMSGLLPSLYYTTHATAKIDTIEELTLMFLNVSLPHYDSISCQETSWSNAPLHIFYSQTLNETFIFNGTSHCCDSFLKDVHFTFLLTKNI